MMKSTNYIRGFMSSLFGACLIFSFVIMYDAVGVRQSVGLQAKELNKIQIKLNKSASFDGKVLNEVCGHNIVQVAVGLILGVFIGLISI